MLRGLEVADRSLDLLTDQTPTNHRPLPAITPSFNLPISRRSAMQVEQAIFTSAQTASARGYHLVARSTGIDDRLAQQLALWAPSENSLIDRDVDAESLNVFSPEPGWIAISRTVSADAEYSNRGQFRIETNMLLMGHDQFVSYENSPLAVARAAIASGYLRLRAAVPGRLTALPLPEALGVPNEIASAPPKPATTAHTKKAHAPDHSSLLQEITELAELQRLVIVGCDSPLDFLSELFRILPLERRLDLSFTTGLKPSTHRPFRLQFLPQVNTELARELEARGMRCLSM